MCSYLLSFALLFITGIYNIKGQLATPKPGPKDGEGPGDP